MNQDEYEKALARVKAAIEFAKDCCNINRCERNVYHFNRGQALICLQDMIWEYESQITTLGLVVDGVYVRYGVPLEQLSDVDVQDQLQYIGRHIPAYVLLREGKKELAKQICQWLGE